MDSEVVRSAVSQSKFEDEIKTRILECNFKLDQWCDIIIPINFFRHWVIMVCNYEKRELAVAYFMKDTSVGNLNLLYDIGSAIRREGIK